GLAREHATCSARSDLHLLSAVGARHRRQPHERDARRLRRSRRHHVRAAHGLRTIPKCDLTLTALAIAADLLSVTHIEFCSEKALARSSKMRGPLCLFVCRGSPP